ncbi:hypothetical protein GGR53DRAFT_469220 [Hypoxylon sp. FL1150]|nr:hypothetical protein GGR53DRAFT_469220 [Hypoxylon sp. FL1150]
MDSKLYLAAFLPGLTDYLYHHNPEYLYRGLTISPSRLKTKNLTTWYLHGPNRAMAFEKTLLLGGSKDPRDMRAPWMAVHQGLYNALRRAVEAGLFPCLRHYRHSPYSFNPLAAELLTSRHTHETAEIEKASQVPIRYEQPTWQVSC